MIEFLLVAFAKIGKNFSYSIIHFIMFIILAYLIKVIFLKKYNIKKNFIKKYYKIFANGFHLC